jgi:hypothetical protein
MPQLQLVKGEGRTKVITDVRKVGNGVVIFIYNENAHIGAVALGEYDAATERVSTSVITRLGHKDDAIAQRAAYLISKSTHRPSCVIAGVHLDDIVESEIAQILGNAESLISELTALKL